MKAVFFFFQAEDGIRDYKVTGVQTCALPICPALERLSRDGKALPIADVRLRAPLPRPGKILACIANYWEHGALEARPLNMFLKSADAVIGPGDTIVLPEFTEPWIFMHEAELALVI